MEKERRTVEEDEKKKEKQRERIKSMEEIMIKPLNSGYERFCP